MIDRGVGGDGLRRPRGDGERRKEDKDEGKDGGDDEEAEHPV